MFQYIFDSLKQYFWLIESTAPENLWTLTTLAAHLPSSQNRVKLFYCLPGKASKLQELNWPSVSQTSESSAQTSTTFIKQKLVNNWTFEGERVQFDNFVERGHRTSGQPPGWRSSHSSDTVSEGVTKVSRLHDDFSPVINLTLVTLFLFFPILFCWGLPRKESKVKRLLYLLT